VKQYIKRMIDDDVGSTATEYAMLASIFAIVALTGARSVGAEVFDLYVFVSEQITAALHGNGHDP
jgi:Flp pilus assembly pilin Flp